LIPAELEQERRRLVREINKLQSQLRSVERRIKLYQQKEYDEVQGKVFND